MRTWIKLYTEILADPKMGLLPDHLWRRCVELFLFAGRTDNGGVLPDMREMEWTLHSPASETTETLEALEKIGIVHRQGETWIVTNFEKRQAAMGSAARSDAHRERQRAGEPPEPKTTWAKSLYESLPEAPGVYRIYCTESGMNYIGASNDMRYRVRQHLSEMKNTMGHAMYDDYHKFGADSIRVSCLETVSDLGLLPEKENLWAQKFPNRYNKERAKNNRHWSGVLNENVSFQNCNVLTWEAEAEAEAEAESTTTGSGPVENFEPPAEPEPASFRHQSNVFKTYEDNIGPITPIISDDLKELEKTYPVDWILSAFQETARKRAGIKYAWAILKRWKAEGFQSPKQQQQQQQPRAAPQTAQARSMAAIDAALGGQ